MKTLIATLAILIGALSIGMPANAGPFDRPDTDSVFSRLGKE